MNKTADRRLVEVEQTGMGDVGEPTTVVDVAFGNYIVAVRLSAGNEFVGICEIRSNMNFLDPGQLRLLPAIDVDAYYKEDNDE